MPGRRGRGKTRAVGLVAIVLWTFGCPSRFDPRAETVKSSPNPEADNAYRQARARLDVGDLKEAVDRFAEFLVKYPTDPLAPAARLGQARAELGLGEPKRAEELVTPLVGKEGAEKALPADPTEAKARYLLGLSLHRQGQWQRSRELLVPFTEAIRPGDDAYELHAVLAEDAAHLGDTEEALKRWELFFPGARPAERSYVRARAEALVAALSPEQAFKLWSTLPHDSLGAAFVGRRVAADRQAAGDAAGAKQILDDSRSARDRVGLLEPASKAKVASRGGARIVGVVLPLTGKGRVLGERALRGALLGASLVGGTAGELPAVELAVRDSGSDPSRAAAAVDELAHEGVVALVGPPEKTEAQLAVARSSELGVPLLGLARDDQPRGNLVFKMVRPRTAVAAALVGRAKAQGARSAAILAPDSAYGRELAQSLVEAAGRAGLKVKADLRYPESATSFVEPCRRVRDAAPDALFIPAPASQLALIAPQLAGLGLVRMQNVKPTGKQLTVYATADGVNAGFLTSTGKYLQGAVLAPSFWPGGTDAVLSAFVERYRRTYGEDPSLLDALSFDAVRAVRSALATGDTARLPETLAQGSDPGASGALGFISGERSGAVPLYTVDNNDLR